MEVKFWPQKTKDARSTVAAVARGNKLSKPQTIKLFDWVFRQNKNPDANQLRNLIEKYKG